MTRSEMEAKLRMLRTRLGEIKEYKRLITAEGVKPDDEDKRRETELIKQVLWLEKKLDVGPKKKPAAKGPRKAAKAAPKKKAPSKAPPKKKSKIRSKQKKKGAP